jgi:hypothetical protein
MVGFELDLQFRTFPRQKLAKVNLLAEQLFNLGLNRLGIVGADITSSVHEYRWSAIDVKLATQFYVVP